MSEKEAMHELKTIGCYVGMAKEITSIVCPLCMLEIPVSEKNPIVITCPNCNMTYHIRILNDQELLSSD